MQGGFNCAVAHPSLLLTSMPCPLPLYQPELQWDLVSPRFCPTPQWLIKKKADPQNAMDLLHFLVQQSRLLSELFLGEQTQRGRNTPAFTNRLWKPTYRSCVCRWVCKGREVPQECLPMYPHRAAAGLLCSTDWSMLLLRGQNHQWVPAAPPHLGRRAKGS